MARKQHAGVLTASWGGTPAGGGIENSSRSITDFLAWTASWNTAVRVFSFDSAVIFSDMWLVVDLLGQISLNVKQRLKPRVLARTFLNIVRKEMPVT